MGVPLLSLLLWVLCNVRNATVSAQTHKYGFPDGWEYIDCFVCDEFSDCKHGLVWSHYEHVECKKYYLSSSNCGTDAAKLELDLVKLWGQFPDDSITNYIYANNPYGIVWKGDTPPAQSLFLQTQKIPYSIYISRFYKHELRLLKWESSDPIESISFNGVSRLNIMSGSGLVKAQDSVKVEVCLRKAECLTGACSSSYPSPTEHPIEPAVCYPEWSDWSHCYEDCISHRIRLIPYDCDATNVHPGVESRSCIGGSCTYESRKLFFAQYNFTELTRNVDGVAGTAIGILNFDLQYPLSSSTIGNDWRGVPIGAKIVEAYLTTNFTMSNFYHRSLQTSHLGKLHLYRLLDEWDGTENPWITLDSVSTTIPSLSYKLVVSIDVGKDVQMWTNGAAQGGWLISYEGEDYDHDIWQFVKELNNAVYLSVTYSPGPSYQDCSVSEWTNWRHSGCENCVEERRRHILSVPLGGGANCPTLYEKREASSCTNNKLCSENVVPEPLECAVTPFGPWSSCMPSCGKGFRYRTREIILLPTDVNEECYPLVEQEECYNEDCDEAKCELTEWAPWSQCSQKCDGGIRERWRRVYNEPSVEGKECPHLKEEESCNDHSCKTDQNCKLGPWTEWGACSDTCQPSYRHRSREWVQHPTGNGLPCEAIDEYLECPVPRCGNVKTMLTIPQDFKLIKDVKEFSDKLHIHLTGILRVPEDRITVLSVRPGSIVVDLEVAESLQNRDDRSSKEVVDSLKREIANPYSDIYTGEIGQMLVGVTIPESDKVDLKRTTDKKKFWIMLIVFGVLTVLLAIALICCVVFCCLWKKAKLKKKTSNADVVNVRREEPEQISTECDTRDLTPVVMPPPVVPEIAKLYPELEFKLQVTS